MGRRTRVARTPRMEQVRLRIENWRKTRVRRGVMAEELWAAAVALAQEHGVYATSRGLGVNYDSLKARVGTRSQRKGRPPALPAFVELPAGMPMAASGVMVELVGAGGEKLTIRLMDQAEVDVAELAREFWSRTG